MLVAKISLLDKPVALAKIEGAPFVPGQEKKEGGGRGRERETTVSIARGRGKAEVDSVECEARPTFKMASELSNVREL